MEIFVSKKYKWQLRPLHNSLNKIIKANILPYRKVSYTVVFNENGTVTKDFEEYDDVLKFLLEEKIYKQNRFPYDILNVIEFIDKGYSIYFY